jgi:hypothetical protein
LDFLSQSKVFDQEIFDFFSNTKRFRQTSLKRSLVKNLFLIFRAVERVINALRGAVSFLSTENQSETIVRKKDEEKISNRFYGFGIRVFVERRRTFYNRQFANGKHLK